MDLLLACNQKLVGSGLDEALALQQTLVEIVGPVRTSVRQVRPRADRAAGSRKDF
jgi:hypothetical protein